MASYRFYNRQSRSKALELLILSNNNNGIDTVAIDDTSDLPTSEFSTVVNAEDCQSGKDLRKITVVYYVTPPSWKSCYGGSISFDHSGITTRQREEHSTVDAMKDRLVLFNSVQMKHRWNHWIGDDDENQMGGMIVLGLVGVPRV